MLTIDDNEGGYPVIGPSGAIYSALTEGEVDYWNDRSQRYVTQNKFFNITDLQEVDRLLMMEMMIWRWSNWISKGTDYYGDEIDEVVLHRQIKEWSTELRLIKKALGLDKPSREKDKGESVADYIENLRRRAKEFGVMREKQLTKSLILFNELRALMTLNANCDETEQREMHCTDEDVLQWINKTAIPEFEEIDNYFRKHQQRTWIQEL